MAAIFINGADEYHWRAKIENGRFTPDVHIGFLWAWLVDPDASVARRAASQTPFLVLDVLLFSPLTMSRFSKALSHATKMPE
jgi:hypothetical protein